MSVGLIHDLSMDNMKSLEHNKEEPNLKMNVEHKLKQEMYVLIYSPFKYHHKSSLRNYNVLLRMEKKTKKKKET